MVKPLQPSTSTFRDLIEGGFLYVDKTEYLYELVRDPKGIYFISRPRRFGKSLFVSALEEIFKNNRELFHGLWIDSSNYQWASHPVIRLDFGANPIRTADELEQILDYEIQRIARENGLADSLLGFDYKTRLQDLTRQLGEKNQVVILIDEYDKPLIDNLGDIEEAVRIRDILRSFYSIIKALDRYIRFAFITGISKFSKIGVFSSMNNLEDLTMDPTMSAAFGITEDELITYFDSYIENFAQKQEVSAQQMVAVIRQWYNGFCFVEGGERVYNPYSTILLFDKQRFSNYWFESGTPTFLIKLLHESNYNIALLDKLTLPEIAFSTFELEHLDPIPILFQTGYLTIKDYERRQFGEETIYTLSYPNHEVERAFSTHLLSAFSNLELSQSSSYVYQLIEALQERDIEQVFTILRTFFANVPYTISIDREAYYQTIFFIIFKMLGFDINAETVTNNGRIDAVVELEDHIYIFEFKLNGSAAEALAQIKEKEYFQKYWLAGKPIICVGANFSTESRTIEEWESEQIETTQNV